MASPVPSTAALSMIARCGAGSWSRRAAMRARNDPGSSESSGQEAASPASSTRNSGLPPPRATSWETARSPSSAPLRSRRLRTRVVDSSTLSGPSGTCSTTGRSTAGGQLTSGSGRWHVITRNGSSVNVRTTMPSWSRRLGSAHCRLSTHSTVIRVWASRRSMSVSVAATASRALAGSRRSSGEPWPSRNVTVSR